MTASHKHGLAGCLSHAKCEIAALADELPGPAIVPSSSKGKRMETAMFWLSGIASAALFAYLFYALIKPERF